MTVTVSPQKWRCFFFKFKGGVISDPKNVIADFLYSKRYILVLDFGKNVHKGGKGGVGIISTPKKIIGQHWKILSLAYHLIMLHAPKKLLLKICVHLSQLMFPLNCFQISCTAVSHPI